MSALLYAMAYRWLFEDLWVPIWPNLAASALTTTAGLMVHHRRIKAHVTAEIKRAAAPGGDAR